MTDGTGSAKRVHNAWHRRRALFATIVLLQLVCFRVSIGPDPKQRPQPHLFNLRPKQDASLDHSGLESSFTRSLPADRNRPDHQSSICRRMALSLLSARPSRRGAYACFPTTPARGARTEASTRPHRGACDRQCLHAVAWKAARRKLHTRSTWRFVPTYLEMRCQPSLSC